MSHHGDQGGVGGCGGEGSGLASRHVPLAPCRITSKVCWCFTPPPPTNSWSTWLSRGVVVVVVVVIGLVLVSRSQVGSSRNTSSPSWLSRGLVVAVVVLVVAVVAAPSGRCAWPRVARGPEAEAQLDPGLATSCLQVEGGHTPRPPDAGEGGEEAVHLRLVLVDVLHVVEAHAEVHGGGEAAPSAVGNITLTL